MVYIFVYWHYENDTEKFEKLEHCYKYLKNNPFLIIFSNYSIIKN